MAERKMKLKEERPELKAEDIQVGKWYRGKNPAKAGITQQLNDREVIYISRVQPDGTQYVQYDSSSVANGKSYPTVTMEAFLRWASHEVF